MNKIITIVTVLIIIAGAVVIFLKNPVHIPVPTGPVVSTTLPSPYISEQTNWPPAPQLSATPYSCIPSQPGNELTNTSEKQINGKTYCVTLVAEGAAGHSYKTYTYVTADGTGSKSVNFTLSYQNCGVYDGVQMTTCQTAQAGFDIDAVVDSLM